MSFRDFSIHLRMPSHKSLGQFSNWSVSGMDSLGAEGLIPGIDKRFSHHIPGYL